jgi:hypothetical protein
MTPLEALLRAIECRQPARDPETVHALAATRAWAASFDPPRAVHAPPLPSARAYADELAKLPAGEMPDLPEFLLRRRGSYDA